jgi:tetratricopeptide (TPR) repeat protein
MLAGAVLLAAAACLEAVAPLVEGGDARYAARAEGAAGGTAATASIDAALDAYREAFATCPQPAVRFRLLRALFFRGAFCGAAEREKRALFDDAKALAESGIADLERGAGKEKRFERLRETPEAVALYFWSAVVWGEWAQVRGTLPAVFDGAAGKIRDLAATVVALDPEFESRGGDRILGRLHDRCPKVPLVTGWVSRDKALVHLRRSLEADPANTVTQLFLAEALLERSPPERKEARDLLERCAAAAPRERYLVEDAHYIAEARRIRARLDGAVRARPRP